MEKPTAISDHAIERYIERVRPSADVECARRDIERLLAFGVTTTERPEWVWNTSTAQDRRWIVCGNLAFSLVEHHASWVVSTVLVKPLESLNARTGKLHRVERKEGALASGR